MTTSGVSGALPHADADGPPHRPDAVQQQHRPVPAAPWWLVPATALTVALIAS
ncbi:hypothetical protein [Modestobacter altitudinis]|uniref:hypothetical protein n=1 Tax=Modestobacter altitudinis TaxID=2213158 RepID=UPI001486D745|nr:hypothetical protein [Modestobacter altitudinis]